MQLMTNNDWSACSDWELVELAKAENETAYALLIERYKNPIHRFIFRYIGSEETAQDLTQEVFIKAYFALAKVKQKAKFSTWLFQITLNLCHDFNRSKAGRQLRATDSFIKKDHDGKPQTLDLPDPSISPNQQAELSELTKLLDQAIHRLPEELRQPFLLGVVEQHPQKEIAALMNISVKAVETRIHRARKFLAEQLEAYTG